MCNDASYLMKETDKMLPYLTPPPSIWMLEMLIRLVEFSDYVCIWCSAIRL